jgi:hypothetical protein
MQTILVEFLCLLHCCCSFVNDVKIRVVVAPAADIVVFIGGVRTVVKLLAWLMMLL